MKHELELFRRETSAAMDHARRFIAGLPAEQVNQRPSPSQWSAGECLDHLTVSIQAYHPILDDAIARGNPRGTSDYRPGWIWRKFVDSLEPPVKHKFKSGVAFVPDRQRPAQEVLSDFLAAHQRVIDALPQLDRLDLGKIRIASPFASWMKYPLGLIFYIVPAHCRRHLWQAEQAVARLPAAKEQ